MTIATPGIFQVPALPASLIPVGSGSVLSMMIKTTHR